MYKYVSILHLKIMNIIHNCGSSEYGGSINFDLHTYFSLSLFISFTNNFMTQYLLYFLCFAQIWLYHVYFFSYFCEQNLPVKEK